jgi:hypothetical protein
MPYLHKSLRGAPAAAFTVARPVPTTSEKPAVPEQLPAAAKPVCPKIFDATWALILGHRQFIRAGVPGCSCGVTFASHNTFVADHTQHLSDQVVRHVLTFVLSTLEAGEAHDLPSTLDAIRAMLPPVTEPEAVPA